MSGEYIEKQETLTVDNYLGTNYSKELIGAFIGDNAEYYFSKWEKSINPEKKTSFNCNAIGTALGVSLGVIGNSLYFREMKRKLSVLGAQNNNNELSLDDVRKIGGTSWKGVGITILLLLLYFVISIVMSMAIGSY